MQKLKAIDLFAGAGGMALGLQQAGLDVVAAVEMNKMCVSTLKANKAKAFPETKIIPADIDAQPTLAQLIIVARKLNMKVVISGLDLFVAANN